MKRLDRILLLGLLAAIFWNNLSALSDTAADLRSDVLRLHILANSNSAEDQQLKYAVRDRLLESSEELFGDAGTLAEMTARAEASMEQIEAIAAEVISAAGQTYSVHAELAKVPFNERTYGALTMPAGIYDALRVTIGAAEGQNWWCVMYPPLCIPAAEQVSADAEVAEEYFSEAELDVMRRPQRYRARFKCLEAIDWVRRKIDKI